MKLPKFFLRHLRDVVLKYHPNICECFSLARMKSPTTISAYLERTKPDFIIGESTDPYLLRWYVIPRNRFFNIYLHVFLRSDDDRALHDHPWWNLSVIAFGTGYTEHSPKGRTLREIGEIVARNAKTPHRIELLVPHNHHYPHGDLFGQAYYGKRRIEEPSITLFVTGPKFREWGFHCPKGWVHWRRFTAANAESFNQSVVGAGCE